MHLSVLSRLFARNLYVITRHHLEPGMREHLLGSRAVLRLPLEDLAQEICQQGRLKVKHAVLLYEYVLERPELQLLDGLELASLVKDLL